MEDTTWYADFILRFNTHVYAELGTPVYDARDRIAKEDHHFLDFLQMTLAGHLRAIADVRASFHDAPLAFAALDICCEKRLDYVVRMLSGLLDRQDTVVIPSFRTLGAGSEHLWFESLAQAALGAILLEETVRHAGPRNGMIPELAHTLGWIADGLALDRELLVRLTLERVEERDRVRPGHAALELRTIACRLELPAQRALGKAWSDRAKQVLKPRLKRALYVGVIRRLGELPGLDDDLWPIAETHLERMGYGRIARAAVKLVFGRYVKLAKEVPR